MTEKEKNGNKLLIISYNFSNKRSKKIAFVFKKFRGKYKFSGYHSMNFHLETSNFASY